MTRIPETLEFDGMHVETADREAVGTVATLREAETVAIIRTSSEPDPDGLFKSSYRTVIFTSEQAAEAERLPYDAETARDGHAQVATRFLQAGETLISVH